jgi:hypothetical protein
MKTQVKTLIVTLVFLMLLDFSTSGQTYSNTTIYTPNSTAVTAKILIAGELSSYWKNYWKNYWLDYYDNRISYLSEATYTYNCHSWAWWMSEGGSTVWLNSPGDDEFWDDDSYIEVSSQSEATKVSFGGPCFYTHPVFGYGNWCDHSAETTGTQDSFISKWGPSPRFEHDVDDCPYDNQDIHYYVHPYISGPEYVCASGTEFIVEDLPSGATISWDCSEDITRVSNQGSNPCEFETSENGDYGWISVSINYDSEQYELTDKEVWQGKPDPHILGPEEVECYWPEWYYIDAESYQWGDWQWSTDYNMEILSVTNGHKAEIQGLSEGYGQIFLEATNECGSNENRLVVWVDCFDFKLIPNPADEYLRIELDDSKIQESNNIDYEIIIFDNQQRPVKKTRSQNLLTTINTKSLSDGVYYVQIIYKGKLYTKQLIIQH